MTKNGFPNFLTQSVGLEESIHLDPGENIRHHTEDLTYIEDELVNAPFVLEESTHRNIDFTEDVPLVHNKSFCHNTQGGNDDPITRKEESINTPLILGLTSTEDIDGDPVQPDQSVIALSAQEVSIICELLKKSCSVAAQKGEVKQNEWRFKAGEILTNHPVVMNKILEDLPEPEAAEIPTIDEEDGQSKQDIKWYHFRLFPEKKSSVDKTLVKKALKRLEYASKSS